MNRKLPFKRSERVSELLHREISRLLKSEINDPRLEPLTVTGVRCSDDLREATVFVSVMGEQKDEALQGLEHAGTFIRTQVGRNCYLRIVPRLHFKLDRTIEQAARINTLLNQIRREGGLGDPEDQTPPEDAER
jgi:ribosome-binding factor A